MIEWHLLHGKATRCFAFAGNSVAIGIRELLFPYDEHVPALMLGRNGFVAIADLECGDCRSSPAVIPSKMKIGVSMVSLDRLQDALVPAVSAVNGIPPRLESR
ncbi:MAG TPA: hypothetical protein PKN13_02185 [Accumulibacter sp.]|nr:hypothetical protein [Accumulibacter sp.]HMW17175.1 hypothetical protein [Accumulibacter sp.]HMX22505.1 hypothetical protein [Accumulibacter sp.]HMY06153.1 hypothetical protein [Accumulibacter sp.]HNC16581.1 hypothetical protein [Accumulibacter sp.]